MDRYYYYRMMICGDERPPAPSAVGVGGRTFAVTMNDEPRASTERLQSAADTVEDEKKIAATAVRAPRPRGGRRLHAHHVAGFLTELPNHDCH